MQTQDSSQSVNYWDYSDRFGYDLPACLHYNPQADVALEDIREVLAVYEGEHDSRDWRWILKLSGGRFALLKGGCDYTGWDCRSSADSAIAKTANQAAELLRDERFRGWSDDEANSAYLTVTEQLRDGRKKTKREAVGEALAEVE